MQSDTATNQSNPPPLCRLLRCDLLERADDGAAFLERVRHGQLGRLHRRVLGHHCHGGGSSYLRAVPKRARGGGSGGVKRRQASIPSWAVSALGSVPARTKRKAGRHYHSYGPFPARAFRKSSCFGFESFVLLDTPKLQISCLLAALFRSHSSLDP